jgi:hypothetical protein
MVTRRHLRYVSGQAARLLVVLMAFGTVATIAPSASAKPRLIRGYINTVTFDGEGRNACYQPGTGFVLKGVGFAPRERLVVHGHRVRADRRGRFESVYDVPGISAPTARQLDIRARHLRSNGRPGAVRAEIQIWAVEYGGTIVPSWSGQPAPHIAQPGRTFRFNADGWFTTGVPLYVHYVKGGLEKYAARLGTLQPPCGRLTVSMTEFPFTPLEPGDYTVDFSPHPHFVSGDGAGFRPVTVRP